MTEQLPSITSMGIGGMLIYLFLKELFGYLKSRSAELDGKTEKAEKKSCTLRVLESIDGSMDRQVRILEKISDQLARHEIKLVQLEERLAQQANRT